MKLILCTSAICLSVLTSVLTTKSLVREEGRRIRTSLSKALTDSAEPLERQESLAQKLEALNNQLANMSRRMTALEEAVRSAQTASVAGRTLPANLQTLSRSSNGAASALTKLEAFPELFAELTTYLDQSFDHLEKSIVDTAAPEELVAPLQGMANKIDAIDSYFTPLYAFLGLVYDPDNADLIAAYPSLDERINELYLQQEATRKDLAALREWLTPRNIDPVKRPR